MARRGEAHSRTVNDPEQDSTGSNSIQSKPFTAQQKGKGRMSRADDSSPQSSSQGPDLVAGQLFQSMKALELCMNRYAKQNKFEFILAGTFVTGKGIKQLSYKCSFFDKKVKCGRVLRVKQQPSGGEMEIQPFDISHSHSLNSGPATPAKTTRLSRSPRLSAAQLEPVKKPEKVVEIEETEEIKELKGVEPAEGGESSHEKSKAGERDEIEEDRPTKKARRIEESEASVSKQLALSRNSSPPVTNYFDSDSKQLPRPTHSQSPPDLVRRPTMNQAVQTLSFEELELEQARARARKEDAGNFYDFSNLVG